MTNPDPMKCECLHWCREWKPGETRDVGGPVTTHHPRCTETAGYCVHQHRRDVESCPYCELIEAEEAAETYHAAWQDAAVYWKAERDELREQVVILTKQRDVARNERDGMVQRRYRWKEAVEERNAAVKERDELLAQVARLKKERADWQPEVLKETTRCLNWSNGEILRLRYQSACLRAALEKYGRHRTECNMIQSPMPYLEAIPCTCGLAEALSNASEESQQ